jgi:outer membrane lipoprotein-sorting protein
MKAPALFLLLLPAVLASCGRSDTGSNANGQAAAGATQTPEEALAAAERASAAGEPDSAAPEQAPATAESAGAGADAGVAGGAPVVPSPVQSSSRPSPRSTSQADSAGRILERAAARYGELRSLQAEFSMAYENPLLRSRTTGQGSMFQKRPDRLLLRFSEPAGDIILSDGQHFWLYYPSVDAAQVLRSEAAAGSSSGVDLQAQFLGDPTRRFSYTLDGEEAVAGRPAWRLTLKPREQLGYRQLRVWIDQRDHLARRFEITEDNGSIRRFDLRNLKIDPALADDIFRFDVPAGARVITR